MRGLCIVRVGDQFQIRRNWWLHEYYKRHMYYPPDAWFETREFATKYKTFDEAKHDYYRILSGYEKPPRREREVKVYPP